MSDDKRKTGSKMCHFAPDEKNAVKEDAILYKKPRSFAELNESADRCNMHVSEHLDQIEAEIIAGSKKKTD